MAHELEQRLPPDELFSAVSRCANSASIGVLMTLEGSESLIAYANIALGELTGYDADELRHTSMWQLICPSEQQRVQAIYAARSRGESVPKAIETEMVHRDGRKIPVELTSTEVTLNGSLAEAAFVFDLSERKMAEQELRSSEARFRKLVDSAPDGVLILRGTRPIFVNPAAADMLQLHASEPLSAASLKDFLTAESAASLEAKLETMQERTGGSVAALSRRDEARGTPSTAPLTRHPISGRLGLSDDLAHDSIELITQGDRTIEVSVILIEYEEQPAFLAFARDVTERNAIQARLVETDRLAAIGMLAAGVAHEINNPLAYVLLNLKYLARELPRLAEDPSRLDALQAHLADASHGAERVQTIVRDLRVYARNDGNDAGPVDLIQVLESAIASTKHETAPRALLTRHYDDIPSVRGVAQRLEQVFVNLFVNAAHSLSDDSAPDAAPVSADAATPQSVEDTGITGAISVEVSRAPNGGVEVCIADNGPGISAAVQKRIFEPFYTTKRPGRGTGLGLPICRKIVESYGGSIHIDSRTSSSPPSKSPQPHEPAASEAHTQPWGKTHAITSHGTRVWVVLPSEEGVPTSANRQSSMPPSSLSHGNARLLIIDDEPTVGQMLGKMLESQFEITVCTSGQRALKAIEEGEQFDAVLCDIMMPTMSGVELYERLGVLNDTVKDRFIFMTGGALLPGVQDFLARVERPKIEKPFDMQELRRLLTQCTKTSNGSPAATK